MKLRIFIFLLLILSVSGYAIAQGGFIPLEVDYATFRSSKDRSYIEMYLSFYQNNLQYLPEENHFVAEYIATAEILQNDSTLKRIVDRRNNTIDSLNEITITRKFLNLFTFELGQGDSYLI